MSARLGVYRKLQTWLVEPWVLPHWMSQGRVRAGRDSLAALASCPARKPGVPRVWFHAASVGELESLSPVIEAWVLDTKAEAIVTVLSESAAQAIRRFEGAKWEGRVVFAGYSPWEGHWGEALAAVRPDAWVTAKYEAWPELWSSLARLGIPLLVVGAKARRSLRLAGALCRILGERAPRLHLLCAQAGDERELRAQFPSREQARILMTGEPRWDRVQARVLQGSERAADLLARFAHLPRPWGVLAQVWPEDMDLWRGRLASGAGTLWVVPHNVDARSVSAIEKYLIQAGLTIQKTSEQESGRPADAPSGRCLLVDEVGVLLNLYAAVDWAYVGGGLGVGMHSTIEPAYCGLPVACGPNGETRFTEIAELTATGQLTLVPHGDALDGWLSGVLGAAAGQKNSWQQQARNRLGATRRVLNAIQDAIGEGRATPGQVAATVVTSETR